MTALSALIFGAMLPANLGSQPPTFRDGNGRFVASARYRNHILCLQEGGRVRVWTLGDGSRDRELAASLSREGLAHLASDGTVLWAATPSILYRWSPTAEAWEDVAPIARQEGWPSTLAIFEGKPLLILSYPAKILMPTDRREFPVPSILGPMLVQAVHPAGGMLWIGTGNGEWGGSLVGFDPQSATWAFHRDPLHNVTGITQARPDELIVSWSNHHFTADTLVRVHRLDGRSKTSFQRIRNKYYQKIVYSYPDRTLYGFDRDELVAIRDGRPEWLAALGGMYFEQEPRAMGFAPAVLELYPVAPRMLVIATKLNGLWVMKEGVLMQVLMQ